MPSLQKSFKAHLEDLMHAGMSQKDAFTIPQMSKHSALSTKLSLGRMGVIKTVLSQAGRAILGFLL